MTENDKNKRHLDDGAYIERGCYPLEFVLTTWNGIEDTNKIYLTPRGAREAVRYIEQEFERWRETDDEK